MPNWCISKDYIYGPTEEIVSLYNKINKLIDEPYTRDNCWLGYIVEHFGIDPDQYHSRGWIWMHEWEIGRDDDGKKAFISFFSESAWNPCFELWDAILKKEAPNCGYYFLAEEPGCEYYSIRDYDDHFFFEDEDFCLDYYCDDEESIPKDVKEFFENNRYVSRYELEEFLKKHVDLLTYDLDTLINVFNEDLENGKYGDPEENYLGIHEFYRWTYDDMEGGKSNEQTEGN